MNQAASSPSRRVPRLVQPGVLLIDAQPGFLDSMHGHAEPVLVRLESLLIIADCLRLPTVATFEAPDASGWLPDRLQRCWPEHGVRLVKESFDCCGQPEVVAAIQGMGRRQLLVAGAQTDVCVLQSVLSLLERGYEVFLLEDCLASSEPHTLPAIRRMYQAGAVPCTLKMAYYELKRVVGVPAVPAHAGWPRLIQLLGSPEEFPPSQPPR